MPAVEIPLPPRKTDTPTGETMPVVAPNRAELLNRAIMSGNIEVAKEFMAMQERYEANMARKAFNAAIADAKAEIKVIPKNRQVDFTSNKGRTSYAYEDLAGIAAVVDPVLSRHGLSYRYRTAQDGNTVAVTCVLSHRDGHCEETTLSGSRDESGGKNPVQQVGSTVTYLQRYTLKAMLGLAAGVDDDAQDGVGSELVSAEQLLELENLVEATGSDMARFCLRLKVPNLDSLPASRYQEAKDLLELKRAANERTAAKD